jgi:DNA helicase-2/ATP-dependent DNA helicase PcrA
MNKLDLPLDASQLAFCKESSSAIRLLAPAGSGKTHSLLWRCRFASENSTEEGNTRFLVFTFTRAARDELRDRLKSDSAFSSIAPFVDISTLNSWGFRRLKARTYNLKLITSKQDKFWCLNNSLQPEWSSCDPIKQALTDSRRRSRGANLIMDLMDRFKSLGFRHDLHQEFRSFNDHIGWIDSNGMGSQWSKVLTDLHDLEVIDAMVSRLTTDRQVFDNFFGFWKAAVARMYASAMLTLEDQKYWASIDIENAIEDKRFTTGVHRYHHILVDEFQDVNPLDLEFLKNIASLNKAQLCIVGDDDQAIYEWRGATPQFILQPEKYLGYDLKTFVLERNYRSPSNIVETSQTLIKHNENRVAKNVTSVSSDVAHIDVVRRPDLKSSVDYVLQQVKRFLSDGATRKIALIGRKRSQIIPYQIVFAGNDIEFYAAEDLQILLSGTFLDMKDMLMLKMRVDTEFPYCPDPVEPVLKLCDMLKRYPLSKKDRGELKAFLLNRRPKSIREAVNLIYEYRGPLKGDNVGGSMSKHFFEAIKGFLEAESLSDSIRSMSDDFDGLQKDYGKSLDDIFYADPPFTFLADFATRYGDDYPTFYNDVEKAIATLAKIPPDTSDESTPADTSWKCPLHLMTALRAKGKEFDVVFVLDCNDGVFPNKFAQTDAEIEAERRLFYVAMTRAKKRLVFVVNEMILGEVVAPSPFLAEAGLI